MGQPSAEAARSPLAFALTPLLFLSACSYYTGMSLFDAWGHSDAVTGLAFAADCNTLLTCSADGCIFRQVLLGMNGCLWSFRGLLTLRFLLPPPPTHLPNCLWARVSGGN